MTVVGTATWKDQAAGGVRDTTGVADSDAIASLIVEERVELQAPALSWQGCGVHCVL